VSGSWKATPCIGCTVYCRNFAIWRLVELTAEVSANSSLSQRSRGLMIVEAMGTKFKEG
jgi:hypothetical protein